MLVKVCKMKQIDRFIMSKVNTKWNIINIEIMNRNLSKLNRNISIITADSRDYKITDSTWLSRGLLTCFWGNIISIIDNTKIVIDKLGKQLIC